MTRSTDPNKINLLLSQNLLPPTSCLYQILAYPTSYNGCVPEINFLLNTVNNSDNALWGSYKRNLLFQEIPKFFFTSDWFLSLSPNSNFQDWMESRGGPFKHANTVCEQSRRQRYWRLHSGFKWSGSRKISERGHFWGWRKCTFVNPEAHYTWKDACKCLRMCACIHTHTHMHIHVSDIYWAGPFHFYLFPQKQFVFTPPLPSTPHPYHNNSEVLS